MQSDFLLLFSFVISSHPSKLTKLCPFRSTTKHLDISIFKINSLIHMVRVYSAYKIVNQLSHHNLLRNSAFPYLLHFFNKYLSVPYIPKPALSTKA